MKVFCRNNQRGFSLVELMTVVGIIGILAAMASVKIEGFLARARMSEAKANIGAIHALELAFQAEHDGYGTLGDIGFALNGTVPTDGGWVDCSAAPLPNALPPGFNFGHEFLGYCPASKIRFRYRAAVQGAGPPASYPGPNFPGYTATIQAQLGKLGSCAGQITIQFNQDKDFTTSSAWRWNNPGWVQTAAGAQVLDAGVPGC